MAERDTGNTGK